ncbi:MAG: FG-GAP repeat protein, partial [Rhizobiaceae bacterium]|nr:FG-GAP repeat protein [Rhizobiaceae bacterium]
TLSAAQGFLVQGDAASDFTGASVSFGGDVNGDGFDDLIVGAVFGDDGGGGAGETYIIFGTDQGFGTDVSGRQVIDLTTLTAA